MYNTNHWGGKDFLSGSGSNLIQTKTINQELPKIFLEFNIITVLDIPCGDFYWMRVLDLRNIKYLGADIVREIV